MPATYINHYCANGGVVVPQFGGQLPLTCSCTSMSCQGHAPHLFFMASLTLMIHL